MDFLYKFFLRHQNSKNFFLQFYITIYRSVLIRGHDAIGKDGWNNLLQFLNAKTTDLTNEYSFKLDKDIVLDNQKLKLSLFPEINLKHANRCFILQKDSTLFFFPFLKKSNLDKPFVRFNSFAVSFQEPYAPQQIVWDPIIFYSKGPDLSNNNYSTRFEIQNENHKAEIEIEKKILLPTPC